MGGVIAALDAAMNGEEDLFHERASVSTSAIRCIKRRASAAAPGGRAREARKCRNDGEVTYRAQRPEIRARPAATTGPQPK